jgi:hypothetical protein
MNIVKSAVSGVRIDAGKAGTLQGDNILIRAVARLLEKDATGEVKFVQGKDGESITFPHPLDEIETI